MSREKMTEMLSEAIYVTTDEANAALEANEWDVLKAAKLLQQEKHAATVRAAQQEKRPRDSRSWLARILRFA